MTEFYYHLFLNYEINNEKNVQFTLSTRKSTGRNSSGCITVFHLGGSKQLQQRIDLKQSTSSVVIVELINYDLSICETPIVFFFISRDRTLYNLFNTDWFFLGVGGIFPYISLSTTKDFTN